jgi:hypothetical protein
VAPTSPPRDRSRATNQNDNERTPGGRGQTTLDLLVGVSVCLVTAGFVLATVSGMADPVTGGQAAPIVADRTTALLVDGLFTMSGSPGVIQGTCTFGFFNASMGAGACAIPYADAAPDPAARLGLPARYAVNVTIRRNTTGGPAPDVLCTDGESVGTCPDTTRLAAGPPPPESESTVSASRGAFLDGVDVVIEVVVW